MRKVLIIPSWYPNEESPALGIFFLEQARIFNKNFEIRILCGAKKTNISRHKKIINTLLFFFLKLVVKRPKTGYFLEPPKVEGFEYECGINLLRRMNYMISVAAYCSAFDNLACKWHPDLIHAHDSYLAGIVASKVNFKYKIPYLISEHNYLKFTYPSYVLKDYAKSLEKAGKTLFVSEYQYRNHEMHGLRCKPEIIGNLVDDSAFMYNGVPYNDPYIFNILFIGRQSHDKDIPTLLKTISEFDKLDSNKNYCFTIIGKIDIFGEDLTDSLIGLDLKKNIKFIEFVGRDAIADFFHSSDVFLCTSISETFGVSICEAMMCGVPVVSTNSGGFDEMYIPGVNGIKVGIRDYKALAGSLISIKNREVIFDPVKIRASVQAKYGTEAFKSKMMPIYSEEYE